MEYSPPATVIGAPVLMPVTVMLFEVMTVLRSTSVCAVKLKGSGVVSAAAEVVPDSSSESGLLLPDPSND